MVSLPPSKGIIQSRTSVSAGHSESQRPLPRNGWSWIFEKSYFFWEKYRLWEMTQGLILPTKKVRKIRIKPWSHRPLVGITRFFLLNKKTCYAGWMHNNIRQWILSREISFAKRMFNWMHFYNRCNHAWNQNMRINLLDQPLGKPVFLFVIS